MKKKITYHLNYAIRNSIHLILISKKCTCYTTEFPKCVCYSRIASTRVVAGNLYVTILAAPHSVDFPPASPRPPDTTCWVITASERRVRFTLPLAPLCPATGSARRGDVAFRCVVNQAAREHTTTTVAGPPATSAPPLDTPGG